MSKADGISVSVDSGYQSNIRFAPIRCRPPAEWSIRRSASKAHSARNTRSPPPTTCRMISLRRAVEQSETLAKLSPDDPEIMPALPPQTYLPVNGYVDSTANLSPDERARAALTALEPARKAGDLRAAGFIIVNAGANALGNKEGLFAYNRGTTANYTLTVRTDDGTGSGWVGAEQPDWKQLDFSRLSSRAIEKSRLSRNPVAIEPGRYTVILEPQAVGDLVQLMAFYLDARESDEGRSAFAKAGRRQQDRRQDR